MQKKAKFFFQIRKIHIQKKSKIIFQKKILKNVEKQKKDAKKAGGV